MRICRRGLNFIQVINGRGDVRICGWMKDCIIGNLFENTFEEIYHGEKANRIRERLVSGDFSNCPVEGCHLMANGIVKQNELEIDVIPEYPDELWLAYEGICNYKCTCCSSYSHMREEMGKDYGEKYDIIGEKLKPVLPHVKKISANGRAELFCSTRTMKILNEWEPLAPPDEVSVTLETNGSLFDEEHWRKIENVGRFRLHVAITVMSFEESAYQYLSGTELPISQLESNLRFVKSLREKEIINSLEIATVVQERNFRDLPNFVNRCLDEFGADHVRLRQIVLAGAQDSNLEWFADIRNPYHPYHKEWLNVIEDPALSRPGVDKWFTKENKKTGVHPGIRNKKTLSYVDDILRTDNLASGLKKLIEIGEGDKLSFYGMGRIGKLLIRLISDDGEKIGELYDKNLYDCDFGDFHVIHPKDATDKSEKNTILITASIGQKNIRKQLLDYGFKGKILDLNDLRKALKEG